MFKKLANHPFIIQLLHWEYWPLQVVYAPVVVYVLYLAAKARSLFFFTAANPSIEMGGLLGESKMDILNKIPKKYLPKTVFVPTNTAWTTVEQQLQNTQISYPLIAKPDIGERGFLVAKMDNAKDLQAYLIAHPIDMILQEYIDYEQEVGVLYYRLPNESKGHVTSLTIKAYLTVTGDGQKTLLELIENYNRAKLQLKQLKQLWAAEDLNRVLPKGEEMVLLPFGTHSRGATFLDANHLIDQQLTQTFDEIGHELEGIYFGRYDIKCASIETLKKGQAFKILEINGVKAEPTHIYDPNATFFNAIKTLFQQWDTIYKISVENHKNGVAYTSFKEGIQATRAYFQYTKSAKQ